MSGGIREAMSVAGAAAVVGHWHPVFLRFKGGAGLARGVYLQIDHIGLEVVQRDHQRAKTIAHLIKAGHLSQLLMSMDMCHKSRLHWHVGGRVTITF